MTWPTKKLGEVCLEIRNIINRNCHEFYEKYFKNRLDDWNILCVSMDIIEDTNESILSFIKKGIKNNIGDKYLKIYGLLQAIFIQQDAIKSLFEVIKNNFDTNKKLSSWEAYSLKAWKELRKYRNLSIGHPIKNISFKKGQIYRTYISRSMISSKGFEIMIWDRNLNKSDFIYIPIIKLIVSYLSEAEKILTDIKNFLENYEF